MRGYALWVAMTTQNLFLDPTRPAGGRLSHRPCVPDFILKWMINLDLIN